MLWSKGSDGSDNFSMCYAPALVGGGFGPSGGHLQCDAGSYFFTESPKFCCTNPRVDINGTTVFAKKKELCGDTLANFNEDSQQIKFLRGPQANAKQEDLDDLAAAGRGDTDEDWERVNQAVCRGDRGTLVTWTNTKEGEKTHAELCPTGTVPVQGRGYMSFQCDGHVIKERRYYCCKVNGLLQCSSNLVDTTAMNPNCNCHQNNVSVAQDADFTFEFGRDELKCFGAEALIQPVIAVTVPTVTPITRKQLELIRNSASFDALHELVSGLAPKLAISSPGNCQNFRNAVAKQCSEFLSIGWRSMNEANSAARVMIGFMEDGLIEPSCALQTALVDSMLTLRDFTRKPRTPRPASGAFTRRPASASASQVRHVQQAVDGSEALKNWVEKTSLLSSFIEVRLLEGRLVGSNLCLVLLDELRRCLQDLKAHDLLKVIPELQKGAEFLASIAVCHREGAVHMISEALIRQEQIEGKGVVAETRSKLQSLGLATKEATEGKVIVGLVADDEVLDFASTRDKIKAASGGRDITWIEAPHGGHRVVMEFVSPLVDFAESARELFVNLTDFQAVAPSLDVSKFDHLDDVRFHPVTAMDDTGDRKRKPHTLEIVDDPRKKPTTPQVLEERHLEIPRFGTPIALKCLSEVSKRPGSGVFGLAGWQWPAGRLLAEVLVQPTALGPDWSRRLENPLQCLELGAGTALPSLCLSFLGHQCIATDLPMALAVTRANVAANCLDIVTAPLILGDISAAKDVATHAGADKFDLIVAADVSYDPVLYLPLLETLRTLRFYWLMIVS
eukprot:symbB.v1.2.005831.t2/scaffold343.1/size224757/8